MASKMRMHPWAITLGKSLKKWVANQQTTYKIVREQIQVDEHTFKHVLGGEVIVGDRYPDFYARLYHLTGLQEASPWTIPDKANGMRRAWTQDMYVRWLKENHPQDEIPIVQVLDVAKLARDLVQALTPYMHTSIQDRDQLIGENGEILGLLYSLVTPLTLNRAERENAIRLWKEMQK